MPYSSRKHWRKLAGLPIPAIRAISETVYRPREQEFGGAVGAVFAYQTRDRHAGDDLYFAIERGVRHAHAVGDEPYVEFLTGDVGKYYVANLTEKFTVGCCHFRYYGVGIGFSRGRDGAGKCRIGCSGDLAPGIYIRRQGNTAVKTVVR